MRRLCAALVAFGLLLGALSGVAAQVRDRARIASDTPLATIAGRVDIESNRQRVPIRRAHVTLTAEASGRQSTTTTDLDGRYHFDRVAAGTYRVRAEKLGFVSIPRDPDRPTDPAAPVVIKAGDTASVDVPMQRGAALEGQFLDDRSHPIAHLKVYADRLVGTADRSAAGETRSTTTDDLGRFRIHTLWPGRYHLHAAPPPPASGGDLYFPGTPSSGQAAVLTLTAGQTLDHLDFMVATAPLSAIAAEALTSRETEATSSAAPDAPGARVAGRVTRSDTGEPIAYAVVQLSSMQGGATPTKRTNADGQFEFTSVSAGSYLLTATADGFVSLGGSVVNPAGSASRLEVKERERIEKADLTLSPPGAIEGRVLDELGDPAPGVSILLTQLTTQATPSVFVPDRGDTGTMLTDDRGWFRMSGLRLGDYYVLAIPAGLSVIRGLAAGSPAPDAGDDPGQGFATTFFPGTDSPNASAPVHVAAGPDVRKVTFGLVGARTVTMAGVATDLAGQPVSDAVVMLIQTHGGEVRTMVGSTTKASKNGSFRFSAVPEGSYVLQGFGTGSFGSLPVIAAQTSTPAPLAVALTLRPLTTARGHISFDGDATPPRDPASVRIFFAPTDVISGPVGGNAILSHINQAWDFEIPNLASKGLIVPMAPPGWSLKGVLLNGRDITVTPHDFQSADVNGLEIVFTSRVGTVAGTVLADGRPAANATVVVFGADESTWELPLRSRFLLGTRPNAQGAFSIPGVVPGRYLAVAVPESSTREIDAAGPAALRPFLAALRPFATSIEVSEGLVATLTLTMIKR